MIKPENFPIKFSPVHGSNYVESVSLKLHDNFNQSCKNLMLMKISWFTFQVNIVFNKTRFFQLTWKITFVIKFFGIKKFFQLNSDCSERLKHSKVSFKHANAFSAFSGKKEMIKYESPFTFSSRVSILRMIFVDLTARLNLAALLERKKNLAKVNWWSFSIVKTYADDHRSSTDHFCA